MNRHLTVDITANTTAFTDAMNRAAAASRGACRSLTRVVTMRRERRIMREHLAATAAAVYADLGLAPPGDSVVHQVCAPAAAPLRHGDTCPMCPGQLYLCTAHPEGVQLHCEISSFHNYRLDGAA